MAKQSWMKVEGTWRKTVNVWQRVNGVWYQNIVPTGRVNGFWKEFMAYIKAQIIYDNGQMVIPWSEGYRGFFSGTVNFLTTHILLELEESTAGAAAVGVRSQERVDVTKYSSLNIEWESAGLYADVILCMSKESDVPPLYSDALIKRGIGVPGAIYSISLDISKLSGVFYIQAVLEGTRVNSSAKIKIGKLWLE